MVVKSATKKKLMDLGFPESWAHILADDRKWDDVKELWPIQIKNAVMGIYTLPDLDIEVMEKWLLLNQLEVKFKKNQRDRIYLAFMDKEAVYYPQTGRIMYHGVAQFRGLGYLFDSPKALKWFTLKFNKNTGTTAIGLPSDIKEWQRKLLIMMEDMPRLYNALLQMESMVAPVQSINRANITDLLW
tara:strand:+ start:271 stop:828 length:558 start_codon:yes stop_codon:yes gene_type:complete